jgi:hypothetical protein
MSKLTLERRIKEIESSLKQLDKLIPLDPDFNDLCEDIIEKLGEIEAIYEDLETDLENMTEEKDILYDEIQSKTDLQILKESVERYNLGVKSEQETILKILEDEFNLSLVCL